MKLFRATYRDRKGRKCETRKWYLRYTDHVGTSRRVVGFTDRRASESHGRHLEKLVGFKKTGLTPDEDLRVWIDLLPQSTVASLVKIGLLDRERAAAGIPLAKHLEGYEAAMRARELSGRHVAQTMSALRTVFAGCGFRTWADIRADAVGRYLSERREGTAPLPETGGSEKYAPRLSRSRSNCILGAVRAFCKWGVRTQIGREND